MARLDRAIRRRTWAPKRLVLPVVVALICFATARGTIAGEVLDRVRRDNVVRCSADERPGVAAPRPDGAIDGLAVDLCRAVAIAVLGRDGHIALAIDAPAQDADMAFVAGEDAAAHNRLALGPIVFVDRLSVLVPLTSRVRTIRDLAGETVCVTIGSPEQSALEAAVGHLGIDITRLAFEEDVEMHDAYAVGRCGAMVGTLTDLSALRGPLGINRLTSRMVPEPLALMPILAATSSTDRDWTTLVFWVVRALIGDVADAAPWPGTIAGDATPAGVRSAWREDVTAVLGEYRATSRRAGGGNTKDAGSNKSWPNGLLAPPGH